METRCFPSKSGKWLKNLLTSLLWCCNENKHVILKGLAHKRKGPFIMRRLIMQARSSLGNTSNRRHLFYQPAVNFKWDFLYEFQPITTFIPMVTNLILSLPLTRVLGSQVKVPQKDDSEALFSYELLIFSKDRSFNALILWNYSAVD